MGTETLAIGSGRMFRYAFGSLLLLAGMTLLVAHGLEWLDLEPKLSRALQGGAICALGTALGAVPVLVIRRMPQALSDTLLGFGAGVMLAATAFSLIVPGIAAAESLGLTPWAASGLICFGILLGAFGLYLVDRRVSGASPEMLIGTAEHPVIPPRIWLFVFAIIAHNIPEGMAVGVSAGGGMPDADSLAMGIALQDAGRSGDRAGAGRGRDVAVQGVFDRRGVGSGRAGVCLAMRLAGESGRTVAATGAGAGGGGDVAGGDSRSHSRIATQWSRQTGKPGPVDRVLSDDGDGYGVGLILRFNHLHRSSC